MRIRTLRGRVALIACLVVAVGFVLTGVALQGAAARQARDRFDDELRDRLIAFAGSSQQGDNRDGPSDVDDANRPGFFPFTPGQGQDGPLAEVDDDRFGPIRQAAEQTLGRGFFLTVTLRNGTIVTLGDEPASPAPDGDDETIIEFRDADGRRWRVLTRVLPGGRGTLQMGGDVQAFVGETVAGFRRLVFVLGSIATLVTGLVTAWAVGRATRPMRGLVETTQAVAATQDLSVRVSTEDVPTEIREVAESLNAMLARIQDAVQSQATALHGARRFAADAGHELRTPLTAMQTTLDSLVRNPGAPSDVRREGLTEVAHEARRLGELLASLQLLARIDADATEASDDVDLLDVAETAVASARERWQTRPDPPTVRVITPPDADGLVVTGLRPWLRSVVDNLLTNAAVHGRPGGIIEVRLRARDQWVDVIVDDDGPGIAPTDRDAVFHRFNRGADADDRPGHGLGLSLVAQLVALHGGSVAISDAPLGGARLAVSIPAGQRHSDHSDGSERSRPRI